MRGRVEHEVRDRAAAVAGPLLPPLDGNDVADALHEPCAHAVVLGDDPLAEIHVETLSSAEARVVVMAQGVDEVGRRRHEDVLLGDDEARVEQ